jgi:hypothetical protein
MRLTPVESKQLISRLPRPVFGEVFVRHLLERDLSG